MSKLEGRIIIDNPLRILGVYSDAPKKEIVANLGKLRAFAKTGKILSFDSDFTTILGSVHRTIETIEKANNDISLPKDKLHAGLFWFMQHTDNDKAAMDCLKRGDSDGAMIIIQKKGNYSGVINMAVLALILKRWDIALYSYAYLLESDLRRGALVKAFTDSEDYFSEDDLVNFISDKLIREFPNAHWLNLLQCENVELAGKAYPFKSRFENSKLLNKIASECITTIKNTIEEVLGKASSVSRNDAKVNLSMAATVEEKCKPLLKELRIAKGKEDRTYIECADNVANQILDNCIDYYTHDTDNPQKAQNVIKYTRYAYRIAESKITKDRAKKNLDILNDTIENQIPESIEEEYNAIDKMVMNYQEKSKIGNCSFLLGPIIDNAYKNILTIKNKVGRDNKHYLSISTNFVYFAFQEIVKKLNADSNYRTETERNAYITNLNWARSLFDTLAKFDKDEECEKDFSQNLKTLNELLNRYENRRYNNSSRTTYSANEESSSEENKGYIYSIIIVVSILILMTAIYNNCSNNDSKSSSHESTEVLDTTETDIQESDGSISTFEQEPETYTTINFSTGDKPYQSTYGKGIFDKNTENCLLIMNGSDTDAVVFLEDIKGKKVRHVFICRGENFTMNSIPGGQYIIKVMQGTDWNPEKDNGDGNPKGGFMLNFSITKSEYYDAFDFPYPASGQYGKYEVTLYKVENGNMQTEEINENDLF